MSKTVGVGVGVLIFNQHNQILMGKRLDGVGSGTWSPPGGHLEFGETFEETAVRETFEEVGIVIETPTFISLTNNFFKEDGKHYIVIFMKGIYDNAQPILHKERHKITEWQWFDLNDLPKNIFPPFKRVLSDEGYGFKI